MKKTTLSLALVAGALLPMSVRATSLPAGTIVSGTNLTQSGTAVNALGQFSFNTSVQYAVFKETATGNLDFLYQVTNQGPAGADSIDHVASSNFKGFSPTVGFVSPTDAQLATAGFTTTNIVNPTGTSLTSSDAVANWTFTGASVPPFSSTAVLVAFTNATDFGLGTTDISNSGSKDFVTWAPAASTRGAPVPEPASFLLLASCLGGMGLCRTLRRRPKAPLL